jgi:type II protein arginine methyltransferase
VLEIGTGTGLLAMMAARAGAAHVFSCEMEPAVALAARDVIARTGLSERITVLSKRSTDVQPAELGGPTDMLVSEILSNDLLAEGALPSVADAIARLVKPGGRVIPARGRVRVALAHEARMESRRIGVISNFDLSPFNRLASPCYRVVVDSPHLQLRSDAADLFEFDFQSGGPWPNRRNRVEVRAHDGPINGIVQWIALAMDEIGFYENRPGPEATSAWAAHFHPFPAAIESRPNQTRTIFARHDGTSLRVWGDLAAVNGPQT